MPCLYVTEPGSVIRRTGRRLYVEKEGERRLEIPIHRLERLLLFGRTQLTADALALLLDRHVAVTLLTRRGQFRGSLQPGQDQGIQLRHRQHLKAEEDAFCLSLAKNIVNAKICSARSVLRRYAANHPNISITAKAQELSEVAGSTSYATTLEQLRGYEGSAARLYFDSLREILTNTALEFVGRNRRPPTDPVNAMLSLGYVVLSSLLESLLQAAGFESRIGFYHSNCRNQPALALDLMEELRHPVVDRFILWLISKRIIQPDHFEKNTYGIRLKPEAKKLFFQHWEEWLNCPQRLEREQTKITPLELIQRQVERLANSLLKDTVYKPFILGA